MRTRLSAVVKSLCVTVALGILPTAAADAASVRFVHAAPGTGTVEARVASGGAAETLAEAVSFGEATEYRTVAAGRVELSVVGQDGDEQVAATQEPLKGDRRYTAVALGRDGELELRVYPDEAADEGMAKLRFIQASPELGEAALMVGEEVVAETAAYRDATPYRPVEPGSYALAATPPGGQPIAVEEDVPLRAGTASTALVLGGAGEQIRFVVIDDSVAAPDVAPATGLGGLSGGGGPPWALLTAATLAAGLLGGGAYRLATARPARRSRGVDG